MQALIFDGSTLRYTADHPDPQPLAGEVVIEPLCMGVCSTDLEICRGYMGFRGILGHEFVGRVQQLGPQVDAAWIGQRVVGTINCACSRCDMCQQQTPEHCRDRTVLGIAGRHGCFADAFTLPAANLLAVPDHVPDQQAVFTEPLAAACEILEQVDVPAAARVTVLGDGRLGLLCAQVLRQHSEHVRIVGKHESKLALARSWQMDCQRLDQVQPKADQDIVVDCTGSAGGLSLAMQMVRPRGTIVLKTTVAAQAAGPAIDLSLLVIHEINLVGSRCGPFPRALAMLADGQIDVTSLVTHRLSLRDGERAMALARSAGAVKVVMTGE